MLTVVTFGNIIITNGGTKMKEHYHHGNLKKELIEVGIRIISEEGFEHLSLRNISKQCGVSHNAIYRHFDNKEQMIDCCRDYVTESLTECLSNSIDGSDMADPDTMKTLGFSYIHFYRDHPTYFSFLYRNSNLKIIFSMDEIDGNYPPFELFRKVCLAYCRHNGLTKEEGVKRLVRFWSIMHGAISLMISSNVELYGNWEDCLNNIF